MVSEMSNGKKRRSGGSEAGEASPEEGTELLAAHGPPPPDQEIPPPDGGWGWMVVFGSFMIHIIADGVTYSFGIFYSEFLNYFQEGKGKTAWIASILVGVTLCSGPISSSFVNRYGCRPVTIAGAILSSICMILSMFAPDVLTLYFTIGIGTGLGFGLIYLPAIVSVTCYFERLRSLATGIAVCGSGLGTFLFAPLTEWLIMQFGWRGAMLLISSALLHCVIFGALFRPLEAPRKKKGERKAIDENSVRMSELAHDLDGKIDTTTKAILPAQTMPQDSEGVVRSNSHSANCNGNEGENGKVGVDGSSRPQRPMSFSGNFHVPPGQNSIGHSQGAARRMVMAHKRNPNEVSRLACSQPALFAGSKMAVGATGHGVGDKTPSMTTTVKGGLLSREDIFYTGSLVNIAHHRSNQRVHRVSESCAGNAHYDDMHFDKFKRGSSGVVCTTGASGRRPTDRETKIVVEAKEVDKDLCCGMVSSPQAKEALRSMLDTSLLKDPIFLLFAFSNFCTSIGFNVPYVYIVASAKELGIAKENASLLLSVIGIANTVGRVALGWVADKPWVNRLWIYNICLTICGIATFLSAFCLDFISLSVYASVYGFTIGAYVGLTSVILVDLLGLQKLTNAFGLLLLFQGIASFLGPPIAGWLYDALGSYNPGFYVAGVMIAVSGLVLFFIPALQRYVQHKEDNVNRR